jgi:deoxycytidylate deaminase
MKKETLANLAKISLAYASKNTQASHRCKHQAFLLRKNKIVAIGINNTKTHPDNLKFAYRYPQAQGTHAEFKACLKGNKASYKGYELVVIRVDNNGQLAMSKPCEGCQRMLEHYQVDTIWYTNRKGEFEVLPIKP